MPLSPEQKAEIQTTVQAILVEVLEVNPEEISPELDLRDDLGVDSVHLLEIELAIEDRYTLEISTPVAKTFIKVQDIMSYVETALG